MILFLAGSETWFRQMISVEVDYMLFSYYYLRSMRQRKLTELFGVLKAEQERRVRAGKQPMKLFLDSGGFTFLTSDGQKPAVGQYADDLIGFVGDTADVWTVVAELDVDDPDLGVASTHAVKKWRETLDDVTGNSGRVIRVWHPFLGRKAWTEFCQDPRFPYLAIGSDKRGQKAGLIAEAHKHNHVVHGFAETKLQTDAKYLKYDSVDSTTWLRPMKYGGFFVFQNNRLRVIDHKHKGDRKLFKSYFKQNGIDMDKIVREDQDELCRASLIVWKSMAARYAAQGAHRARQKAGAAVDADQDATEESDVARGDREHEVHTATRVPAYQEVELGGGRAKAFGDVDQYNDRARVGAHDPAGNDPGFGPSGERDRGHDLGGDEDGRERESAPAAPGRSSVYSGRSGDAEVVARGVQMKKVLVIKNGVVTGTKVAAKLPRSQPLGVARPLSEHGREPSRVPPESTGTYRGLVSSDPKTWLDETDLPRCIPARNTGHAFTTEETRQNDAIGDRLGCHLCGSKTPGEEGARRSAKRWIKDHLPPTDDLPKCAYGYHDEEGWKRCQEAREKAEEADLDLSVGCARHDVQQVLVPSCEDCSLKQGGGRNVSIYTKAAKATTRVAWTDGEATENAGGANGTLEAETAPSTDTLGNAPETSLQSIAESRRTDSLDGSLSHRADTLDNRLGNTLQCSGHQLIGESTGYRGLDPVPEGVPPVAEAGVVVLKPDLGGQLPSADSSRFGLVHQVGPSAARGLKLLQSLPGVVCSNCAMQGECPKYEEGSACFFTDRFGALEVRNMDHLMALREWMLSKQKERVARGFMQEDMTGGGQLDPRVSQEMDRFSRMMDEYESTRQAPAPSPVRFQASASGPDGTMTVEGSGRGAGFLARLFGAPTESMENEPARGGLDVDPEVKAQ